MVTGKKDLRERDVGLDEQPGRGVDGTAQAAAAAGQVKDCIATFLRSQKLGQNCNFFSGPAPPRPVTSMRVVIGLRGSRALIFVAVCGVQFVSSGATRRESLGDTGNSIERGVKRVLGKHQDFVKQAGNSG